jgi:hypothetical protein
MTGVCSPRSQLLRAGGLILTLLVLAGCGRKFGVVDGKVTVDGRPANSGRVFFKSADDKGEAVAYIGRDGAYHAIDVPLGAMKVWVTPPTKMERQKMARRGGARKERPADTPEPEPPLASIVPIPQKYQDPTSSGLTTTVQAGPNTYNIEMSSR